MSVSKVNETGRKGMGGSFDTPSLSLNVRQGFDKNLAPQSAYAFRAFGNSFMVYMVL